MKRKKNPILRKKQVFSRIMVYYNKKKDFLKIKKNEEKM